MENQPPDHISSVSCWEHSAAGGRGKRLHLARDINGGPGPARAKTCGQRGDAKIGEFIQLSNQNSDRNAMKKLFMICICVFR